MIVFFKYRDPDFELECEANTDGEEIYWLRAFYKGVDVWPLLQFERIGQRIEDRALESFDFSNNYDDLSASKFYKEARLESQD